MVGSAILNLLKTEGFKNIITLSSSQLDLTNQNKVYDFFKKEKPHHVYLAAAKVGGIYSNNNYPGDFIYQNIMIQTNVIESSRKFKVERLLFLGSSCIYPKKTNQPIQESDLLTGHLEPTNEPYAIAKIAGLKLCESYNRQFSTDFRSIMPTNLYGPGDNFDIMNSHVIPALIRKIHDSKLKNLKKVEIWGTGIAQREFLHVFDLAKACYQIMKLPKKNYNNLIKPMRSHINIGSGEIISIKELARLVADIIGFKGELELNNSYPDGTLLKNLNSSLIKSTGWRPQIKLKEGLINTYEIFKKELENEKKN